MNINIFRNIYYFLSRRPGPGAVLIATFISLTLAAPAPAAALEYRVETLSVPGGVVAVRSGSGNQPPVIEDGRGNLFRLMPGTERESAPRLEPLATAPVTPETRPGMLPDGEVSQGGRNIRAAWLSQPVDRYDHGVLGDDIEAGGLMAELRNGKVVSLTLEADSVFEDRLARIIDADGDGDGVTDVIVPGRFRQTMRLVSLKDGKIVELARIPPKGLIGTAIVTFDLDGDGRKEAVYGLSNGTLVIVTMSDTMPVGSNLN